MHCVRRTHRRIMAGPRCRRPLWLHRHEIARQYTGDKSRSTDFGHRSTWNHHQSRYGRLLQATRRENARGLSPNETTRCPRWTPGYTKSGRRDSNPRHPAWEASALPTELRPRPVKSYSSSWYGPCNFGCDRRVRVICEIYGTTRSRFIASRCSGRQLNRIARDALSFALPSR